MKKLVILTLFVLASISFADPFFGYSGRDFDTTFVSLKSTISYGNFNQFYDYALDSNVVLEKNDTLKYSKLCMHQRLSVRIYPGIALIAEIPYVSNTLTIADEDHKASGVGDIDLYLKYRPVTSENPIILLFGATLPTGQYDEYPALGANSINATVGVLNTKEYNGFELTTNLMLRLSQIRKDKKFIPDYFQYIGTAAAPVLMNGQRIGSITGEVDAWLGYKIKEQYMVQGTLGVEWRATQNILIQGGVAFPIIASDEFPQRSVSPVFALELTL